MHTHTYTSWLYTLDKIHTYQHIHVHITGVLGLAALVGSHPYDVPSWMPQILVKLASHISEPMPIKQVHASICVWKNVLFYVYVVLLYVELGCV